MKIIYPSLDQAMSVVTVLENLSTVNLYDEEAREILEKIHDNPNIHLIACVDEDNYNKIVGVATILIEQKIIHRGGKVGHIEDVVVLPEYREMGIGANLIGRCIDKARKIGCYKVILNCSNKVKGFYEQIGFKAVGIEMRYDI